MNLFLNRKHFFNQEFRNLLTVIGFPREPLSDEIARREGIEAQESEVEAEVARLAERAGKSREAVRAQLAKEGELAALAARIREEKTLDLLKSNASIELT